jgi:hypothetical protein
MTIVPPKMWPIAAPWITSVTTGVPRGALPFLTTSVPSPGASRMARAAAGTTSATKDAQITTVRRM